MSVIKGYHPNAILLKIRNVKPGLEARTKILIILDDQRSQSAKAIANKQKMSYKVVIYHLKLLMAEQIVKRKKFKPYLWNITGYGQRRLEDHS